MCLVAAHPTLANVLAGVGLAVTVAAALYLVYLVLEIHVLPGKSLTTYGATPRMRGSGAWALVTGASDGIGKAFALQLAKAGFNVVLVSRTLARLEETAREIEATYPGTKTLSFPMDFGSAGDVAYAELGRQIQHLDVSVLINNVGASHAMPVPFVETADDEISTIVQLNIIATLKITQLVGARLVARNGGLVLTIGSFSGTWNTPLLGVYAGSKAFLASWSQAIGEELRRAHVDVQLVNTYFVTSKLSKVRRPSLMIPTPEKFVRSVLSRVGRSSGALGRPFTITPYPAHAWLDWAVAHVLPAGAFLRYAHDVSADTRKRALRKIKGQ
ncbi:hypothetical protein MSPP1_000332 [Malassezia sp. CBS 17886]|nr:hypothetical protein MSPP1_000332 [Malassezia sp. CBS 17886]